MLISQTFNEADELAEASGVSFLLRFRYSIPLRCEQSPRGVGYDATCTWDKAQHAKCCGTSASKPFPPRNHRARFIDGFTGVIGVAGRVGDVGCWRAFGRRKRFSFGSRLNVIVSASQTLPTLRDQQRHAVVRLRYRRGHRINSALAAAPARSRGRWRMVRDSNPRSPFRLVCLVNRCIRPLC